MGALVVIGLAAFTAWVVLDHMESERRRRKEWSNAHRARTQAFLGVDEWPESLDEAIRLRRHKIIKDAWADAHANTAHTDAHRLLGDAS